MLGHYVNCENPYVANLQVRLPLLLLVMRIEPKTSALLCSSFCYLVGVGVGVVLTK